MQHDFPAGHVKSSSKFSSLLHNQLRDVPPDIRTLLFLQFLMNLSSFVAMPLMAVFMAEYLKLGAAVIGTVFTIHLALGRALPIVTGPLVDRFGFRGLMVIGLVVRAAGFLCFSYATDASSAILATLLIGLGTASYESALYGVFGRQPETIVTRVFILNNFALNLGVVVGPSLGALLISSDVLLPFRVAAVLFLVLGIWSIRFGYLDHQYASRSAIVGSWGTLISDRRFLLFLATTLPWWFLFAQLFVAFPLLASRVHGEESAANWVFITNGTTGLIFVVASLVVFKWVTSKQMILYCYAVLALIYLSGLAWENIYWILAIVFFYTVAETFILPAIETITADLAPDGKQATYFGALGLAWGAGAAAGSYVGSWLVLELENHLVLWITYATVAAIGLISVRAFRSRF